MVVGEDLASVRIIDFGICGNLQTAILNDSCKRAGTLKYMPPETVSGETYVADSRIDSWSLGVLIYYCLYGRHPFTGEN